MAKLTDKEFQKLAENSDYWKHRAAKVQENITSRGIKATEREIKNQYSKVSRRLMKEFENVYQQIELITAQGKTPTTADLYKMDKYWKLLNHINNDTIQLVSEADKIFYKAFKKEYQEIYNSIALKGSPLFNDFSEEKMEKAIKDIWCSDGKGWSDRLWMNREKLIATLEDELTYCVSSGAKTSQLKQLLQEQFEVSYHNANTICRTEMAHIQTASAQQRYRDYGIEQIQVWAEGDERQCEICGKLHKQIYPNAEKAPVPAHPNCRCTIIPVVEI